MITVRIIAEHDPAIAPFQVRLLIRRVTEDPPWQLLGAQIEPVQDPKTAEAFERLVRYYSGAAT